MAVYASLSRWEQTEKWHIDTAKCATRLRRLPRRAISAPATKTSESARPVSVPATGCRAHCGCEHGISNFIENLRCIIESDKPAVDKVRGHHQPALSVAHGPG
jgi:hypothetical protein